MRRPINWITVSLSIVFLIVGLSLSGCGSGGAGTAGAQDAPAVPGLLRKVRSADELESSLRAALRDAAASGVAAGPVPVPAVDVSSFSTTNTTEAGVDEFDIARFDGAYLYVTGYDIATDQRVIRILRTDETTGQATPVSSIALAANEFVQGMYVADGRMMVLSSGAYFLPFGDLWASIAIWAPSSMTLRVYDVVDPAHPRQVMNGEIDGVFVASRRIDDRVYLVSRHTPRSLIDPIDRPILSTVPLTRLLPRLRFDGSERPLVTATNCYVSNDDTRHGYPVITTITMLSLSNPRDLTSTCYDEPADGVYASRTALYISQPRIAPGNDVRSRIHKFALTQSGPSYSGSVEVQGAVWSGGQNDYRMNEQDGYLRVFATEWTSDPADSTDNYLYVLRQKAAEPALEVVGRLPNDLRPEEIGRPGEGLYGVRFVGDRAYGITFRRVDPLYVFDLSNPADPRIAGELEIPGVSDYLHPVGPDLLLGLGRDNGLVKLELFDTSVLSNPQSRGAITLGNFISYSEAIWDHHAFAYLPGDTDRLAFPATIVDQDPSGVSHAHSELRQFEVRGKQVPSSADLVDAGAVLPPTNPDESVSDQSRAFIQGAVVWYVRDGQVWSSDWLTPGEVRGPF